MRPNEQLLQRVRGTYERARLWKGLRAAAFAIPLTLVSFGCCGNRVAAVFIAGALAVVVAILVWRGGPPARAVVPGYVAGLVPLAVPLLACPACASMGVTGAAPLAACVVGGIASGAIVVYYAAREREDRASFVLAGGAIAALAGSLGCVIVGLGGVAAMAVGLVLVAPFALRPTRAN